MISPDEQAVAKYTCYVIGMLIVGGFIAVLFMSMVSVFKGDK